MRGVVRNVAEEGLFRVLIYEGERVIGKIICNEPFAANRQAIVFEGRIVVFAPMAGGEAVVFGEAARIGMIRPLAAVVPFAKSAGGIARGLESVRDGAF